MRTTDDGLSAELWVLCRLRFYYHRIRDQIYYDTPEPVASTDQYFGQHWPRRMHVKFTGAREAVASRLMGSDPVRHPELAAAPDLNAKAHL